jgi:hypothetical protein
VPTYLHLEFPKPEVSEDLRCFFATELGLVHKMGLLPRESGNLELLLQRLVRSADAIFLWVRLMVSL